MNETLVQSFLAIATEGGFNKAAEKIYISQPNLSRNIARLEKELGTKLFDRSRKRAVLTRSGDIYFAAFQKMMCCLEQAREQVKSLENEESRTIRIGYVKDWNVSDFIGPVLGRLKKNDPGVRVVIEACSIPELSSKLSQGEMDLIITLKDKADGIYGARTMGVDHASDLILYSKEYSGRNKDKMRPEDFRDEVFLVLADDGGDFRIQYVKEVGAAYGFVPDIRIMNNMESILMNVENGMGVTICNSWMRAASAKRVAVCRLDHTVEIGMAWKDMDSQPAFASLLDYMKEAVTAADREKITG